MTEARPSPEAAAAAPARQNLRSTSRSNRCAFGSRITKSLARWRRVLLVRHGVTRERARSATTWRRNRLMSSCTSCIDPLRGRFQRPGSMAGPADGHPSWSDHPAQAVNPLDLDEPSGLPESGCEMTHHAWTQAPQVPRSCPLRSRPARAFPPRCFRHRTEPHPRQRAAVDQKSPWQANHPTRPHFATYAVSEFTELPSVVVISSTTARSAGLTATPSSRCASAPSGPRPKQTADTRPTRRATPSSPPR